MSIFNVKEKLFRDSYSKENFKLFQDELKKDNFGNNGSFTYFCKNCNVLWNFEYSIIRDIWKHLHKIGGCGYDYVLYHKTKNSKQYLRKHNDKVKEIHSFVQKQPMRKSTMSAYSTLILNDALQYHKLGELDAVENNEKNVTTNVSGEPTA